MDWLAFDAESLYFDDAPSDAVCRLLNKAADHYGEETAEHDLNKAYALEPQSLMVLVALFRFYFYQQRLSEALAISAQARTIVAEYLSLPARWEAVTEEQLRQGKENQAAMARFYLLCLKGEGYLHIRLGERDQGMALLNKVVEMDPQDHFGASALMAVVDNAA